MSYLDIYEKQRAYFDSGATRSYEARLTALKALQKAVQDYTPALLDALHKDLNKHPYEATMCETGLILSELRHHIRCLKKWMKNQRVPSPIYNFPSRSFQSPEPYGLTYIIGPWNYPAQLCLLPLIGALSAGNCAVVKPSTKAPETARVLGELLASVFPEDYVYVAQGSREETAELLELKWDYIFFTGSQAGGQQVLQAAARHLTPVSLELGGKSPAIVDPTANLKLAARRIAFGKVLNAGQTCVAPDYLLIHESVLKPFLTEYARALEKFFPKGDRSQMVKIINDAHFLRLTDYLEDAEILLGGTADSGLRHIAPSVVAADLDEPIMQEEVFGPILPVITWKDLDWCAELINHRDKPLAMYIFTGDNNIRQHLLDRCSFGGGCINDTVMHCASASLPFGGVGSSGMGSYHGKKSFETFTHYRSILDHKTWLDLPLRYFPYSKLGLKLIRLFLR